ncbi:fimbria/pilus outer membrane usher protein [Enterobacillus tribolii]|uniref:Outer membrane usher protein n=1 Tax=Enterobacillus tribolii TaxID=1487935 RepID=A0A370QS80_9GAMM|nr:fimbria/pilus outer membrane usher protein [Enterobacillus tribolii]MBW7983756.1 fimbrial biogenesis outer membrane usher protein [Enterobacillus tribolii]RDK92120.1 outer membrane usher protein [Enterobacillus tribolii]
MAYRCARRPRKTQLSRIIQAAILSSCASSLYCGAARADDFNMSFIHGSDNMNAAQAVAQGDAVQPGTYPFDIYLNGTLTEHRDVTFRRQSADKPVIPCFSRESLAGYGIRLPAPLAANEQCLALDKAISGATISYDVSVQRVDISVPQAFMDVSAQGAISPRLYDNGINALYANYNFSYNRNDYKSGDYNDSEFSFLSLNSGLNLGRWRLRNNATMSKQSGYGARWKNISSWAETDLVSLRSRLQAGQVSTDNRVFDSFQFRGVQLSSVDQMLPESLRGYAPVIRGVALTNARVEVRQNGYVIYSTNVAPGAFSIHDIYPSTNSGDLSVTVNEADGTKKSFTVPFSSVANMLREGIWNYQLTAGKYHDGTSQYQPTFLQATVARGVGHDFTPYGGVIMAEHYRSAVAGVGKSLGGWGAVSVDASVSDTELASGGNKRGQSYRFLYSKSLNSMGTDFRLAGYRYATSGYYDFSDAVAERDRWRNGYYSNEYQNPNDGQQGIPDWADSRKHYYYSNRYNNKRERVELAITQNLWPGARLYANVSRQTYWGYGGNDRTVQLGFSDTVKRISYGLYVQDTRSQYGYSDRSVNFTLSVPFNFGDHDQEQITVNTSAMHSRQSGDSYNTGLSGSLLDDRRLSYSLYTGHTHSAGQTSGLNADYRGSMGNVSGGYSYSNRYQQENIGLAGGVLVHSGGVTLSQPLQNTFMLVEAKNARGVRLENQPGVAIDRFGYAVLPSATPYRYNRVALRTQDIGAGLDVPIASQDVVPTEKAIVRVAFDTYTGHSLLIHTRMANGDTLPIGAVVFNEAGRNSGTVGLNGDVYVSGIKPGEKLKVVWGEHHCRLTMPGDLGDDAATTGYREISLTCNR